MIWTKRSEKQTRNKRACDQCAKSKLKCDFQVPCERCRNRSIVCEISREGHHDPYSSFSIAPMRNIESYAEREAQKGPVEPQNRQQPGLIEFPISPAASNDQHPRRSKSPMSPVDSNERSVQAGDSNPQILPQSAIQVCSADTFSESTCISPQNDRIVQNTLNVGLETMDIDYHNDSEDFERILAEMTDQYEPFVVPHMPFLPAQGN